MKNKKSAASIRAKLLNHAKATGQDFNLVLTRFCLERLLYRMSLSDQKNNFLLKGAMLFDLWFDMPHRPTRDVDFLGFGSSELEHLKETFKGFCSIEADDGIELHQESVRVEEIRKDANYSGVRILLRATLEKAQCMLQADVGFGDAVTPSPVRVKYPTILSTLPSPTLLTYPRYTVVAEKFEAITHLGMSNSRMKDYFDLWILAKHTDFDGQTLGQAIQATFESRKSPIPNRAPLGLIDTFSLDRQKQTQWRAFLKKNDLQAALLEEVVTFLNQFLLSPMDSSRESIPFNNRWKPGGPWQPIGLQNLDAGTKNNS